MNCSEYTPTLLVPEYADVKLKSVGTYAGLAVTIGHRTNSGLSCNVSGQICYLSGHK